MATKTVQFEVTPGDGVSAYWLAVGDQDVLLVNGKGQLPVESPASPYLIWWFVGNPKAMLTIVGTVGKQKVVGVKESRIPKGETEGAGTKRFKV